MPCLVGGLPNGTEESNEVWGEYERPGDIKNMKCHDCCCVFVFLLLFLGMIGIMINGFIQGDIYSVYRSWDDQGQYCGFNNQNLKDRINNLPDNFTLNDLTKYPYLFFDSQNPKHQICVAECPNEGEIQDALLNKTKLLTNPIDPTDTFRSYKSKNIFNRCIPELNATDFINASGVADGINQIVDSIPVLANAVNGVSQLWMEILVCSIGSLIVALVWICLLRCCTGCIVYIVVFLVPILGIGLGVWLFFMGDNADTIENILDTKKLNAGQITAIVVWCISLILILIIIFLFKKLKGAIAIIKIAAKALGANLVILFVPLLSLIIAILFWAVLLVSSVYNYTANDFSIIEDKLEFDFKSECQYLLIFNVIYLVFITVHIVFVNYYAMSASIVNWYFSGQGGFGCGCMCLRGFLYAFSKSLGTITISTIITTPLYLLLMFFEYLDRKSQAENASQFIKFIIKCFKCCIACFTKLVKYLNTALLTAQQVFNRGWYKSAQVVADVVVSDALMTVMLNGVSFFILVLSKLVVTGITTLLFCVWVHFMHVDVNGWILPACIVFGLSYVAASFLLSAYSNVIDIVFICYQSELSIPGCDTGETTAEMKASVEAMKATKASSGKVGSSDKKDEDE